MIAFASLMHPEKYAYTIHESTLDLCDIAYRTVRPLADWAGMYKTYGEGLGQHSSEWVPSAPSLEDYCVSLASYCLTDPTPLEWLSVRWPMAVDAKRVQALMAVKFNPEKRCRYVEIQEGKVSAAESKRHDRRWHEIPEWADGTATSVYRLMHLGKNCENDLLPSYALYVRIRVLVQEFDGYGEHPVDHFKLSTERRERYQIHDAFQCLDRIVEGYRFTYMGRSGIEIWQRNLARKRETAAEAAGTAPAEVA